MDTTTALALRFTPAKRERPALLEDLRCGLSVALPGYPDPSLATPLPGLPRDEIFLPDDTDQIALAYQLDEVPGATLAGPLALSLATTIARARAKGPVDVGLIPPAWLQTIGAEGGARARYQSASFDEDLLVLRRGAHIAHLYILSSSVTHRFRLLLYRVAVHTSLRWERPDQLPRTPPALFTKNSDFLSADLALDVIEFGYQLSERALRAPTEVPERAALWQRMKDLLEGEEPHTQPITPEERATYERFLTDVVTDPVMLAALREGLARVRSAFDLRGFLYALMPSVYPTAGAPRR